MKKIIAATTVMMAALGSAHAQTSSDPLHFLIGLGVTNGGDKLAHIGYTDNSWSSIRAGGGVVFTGGANYRLSPEFSVQGTLNFHVDDTDAKNGGVKFQRFPIELLGYYHAAAQWRFGAGVRYVSSPKLSSSGFASGIGASFKDTVGGVVEGEYLWNPQTSMKVRYVNETFKQKNFPNAEVDGSHFGISMNYYF